MRRCVRGRFCGLGLRVNKLALELHVPATRIGEIVHERRRKLERR